MSDKGNVLRKSNEGPSGVAFEVDFDDGRPKTPQGRGRTRSTEKEVKSLTKEELEEKQREADRRRKVTVIFIPISTGVSWKIKLVKNFLNFLMIASHHKNYGNNLPS